MPALLARTVHDPRCRCPMSRVARLSVLLALLGVVQSGAALAQPSEAPPAIRVVAAQRGEVRETVRLTGSVVAGETVSVSSRLDDFRILTVRAEAGDVVRAGDVLAELDDTMLRVEEAGAAAKLARAAAAVRQAKVATEDAEIALDQIRSDLRRSAQLRDKRLLSQGALEAQETALRRADAALATAREGFAGAEADQSLAQAEARRIALELGFTKIRAPTGGKIARRTASIGAIPARGGEPLFQIIKDGLLEIDGEVSERGFAKLQAGQMASVRTIGAPDAIMGRLRLLQPELGSRSRLGRLRVTLPQGTDLPIGAFASGEIEVGIGNGVVLPTSAVQTEGGASTVLTYRNGAVTRTMVRTGIKTADLVQVLGGVEAGDSVVLKSAGVLADGDRVTPIETPYPASPTGFEPATLRMASER